MKTVIIIQARMGSTRLPGKVLRPLGNSNILHYVVSRCKAVESADQVIVATTTLQKDDSIEKWCYKENVQCFRGSEDDVLERYYECAKQNNADIILRVTADCPFIDYQLMNQQIKEIKVGNFDLLKISGRFPRGVIAGIMTFEALELMYKNGQEARHREHVTYYATEYPEDFKIKHIEAPKCYKKTNFRITVDTEEDYLFCYTVAKHFHGDERVEVKEVIEYLMSSPEIVSINSHIKQKPVV